MDPHAELTLNLFYPSSRLTLCIPKPFLHFLAGKLQQFRDVDLILIRDLYL